MSDGSDGLQRNDFRPPLNAWWQFSKCLTYEQKLHMSDGIFLCPMDPTDSIGTTFDPLWTLDDNLLSVLRTETPHVRWNLFVSDGSDGLHRNEFRPPLWTLDYNFLSVLRTETPHVRWNLFVFDGSDGLYRNDFRPPLSAWWQFSKCLTNRNSACPMESIRVRWIRWTPSERLSTPSERLMTIF